MEGNADANGMPRPLKIMKMPENIVETWGKGNTEIFVRDDLTGASSGY
jgi:hypothetical protein